MTTRKNVNGMPPGETIKGKCRLKNNSKKELFEVGTAECSKPTAVPLLRAVEKKKTLSYFVVLTTFSLYERRVVHHVSDSNARALAGQSGNNNNN